MFTTGVLCTLCGAQVYLFGWNLKHTINLSWPHCTITYREPFTICTLHDRRTDVGPNWHRLSTRMACIQHSTKISDASYMYEGRPGGTATNNKNLTQHIFRYLITCWSGHIFSFTAHLGLEYLFPSAPSPSFRMVFSGSPHFMWCGHEKFEYSRCLKFWKSWLPCRMFVLTVSRNVLFCR